MIQGISIYEILTLTSAVFFIGVYGFLTRKNLITMLLSIELILNASAINFVVINKYLFPDNLQGVFFSVFIVAVAAARKNLITMLLSIELILNASAINFVVINKYLFPDNLQGVFFSVFIVAVAAAETALAVAIIINLYKQIASVEVKDTEIMKY